MLAEAEPRQKLQCSFPVQELPFAGWP